MPPGEVPVNVLFDEISNRFPEISGEFDEHDRNLPYNLMGCLVDWLKRQPAGGLAPALVERVVAFADWCERQPRGETAADDLLTIVVVGFYENLFDSETTRPLVPKLIPHANLMQNADYLRTWVGRDNFEKTLRHYGKTPGRASGQPPRRPGKPRKGA